MADDNNSLAKSFKIPFKKTGIGARVEAAGAKEQKPFNPSDFRERLCILFDDSGSMMGDIAKAQEGVDVFLKNCNPLDTAMAVYCISTDNHVKMTNRYIDVIMEVNKWRATGGTPLYSKCLEVIEKEPVTRLVVFSDGAPGDAHEYNWEDRGSGENKRRDKVIALALDKNIPIDTVYIGPMGDSGYQMMLYLAEKTAGVFLHFTDASVLKKNLKYLAPAHRFMLANAELKEKIERGESI